jgi:tetratricopeptide (TPR) repeat protein
MKKFILFILILPLVFTLQVCKKKVYTAPGRIKKGTPEYTMNMGLFYLNEGKINIAEKELKKALRKRPDMVKALNGLGIVYIYKREFKKAIKYFNDVLRISPGFHDANNFLGLIYTELGNYDLAKENLLIAANSDTYENPENAFHNLARLEFEKKKYKSAMRYVDKGLYIDKNFAPLLNMKGLIYEIQKEYYEAIKYFNKARSVLTKDDVFYLINIGRVYIKMGKKNKALDILEKALATAVAGNTKALIRKMIKQIE